MKFHIFYSKSSLFFTRRFLLSVGRFAMVGALALGTRIALAAPIDWHEWSADVLAQARARSQLVLVSGASARCPWCRKMNAETFGDPALQRLVEKSFIPVRVDLMDGDTVPHRFREMVPPTIMVLTPEGKEVASHTGFLTGSELSDMLRNVLGNALGDETATINMGGVLGNEGEEQFQAPVVSRISSGEWRTNPSVIEFQQARARNGAHDARIWIDRAADEALELRGSSDQRSLDGADDTKMLEAHLAGLRVLIAGYRISHDAKLLDAAKGVGDNVRGRFRRSDGTYGLSGGRGADDLDIGVSVHIVRALLELYGVTDNSQLRSDAETLAAGLRARIGAVSGRDRLWDRAQVGRAFLDVYAYTGERRWLLDAKMVVEGIRLNSMCDPKRVTRREQSMDGAVAFIRVANLLFHYSGEERFKVDPPQVSPCLNGDWSALSHEQIIERYMAKREMQTAPVHISVVGSKDDLGAQDLWRTSLRESFPYLRREWLDSRDGSPPHPDVVYPRLSRAAAFVCANKRCSLPLFTGRELEERIAQITPHM